MAQRITLESGSILNGSPITFNVKPNSLIGSTPSFHRVVLEIECGMTDRYEVIKLSAPVPDETGTPITIDISSALRTFRDSYQYTPLPTTYPIVKFNVRAYDEYMLNGDVKSPEGEVWFPVNPNILPADSRDEAYLRTIFGSFSDVARLTSSTGFKGVQTLSLKPKTSPQLVAVGETLAYTPAYSEEQQLFGNNTLIPPESKVAEVKKEGLQTLGYQSIYALPATESKYRQVFRFINSFGVLESISIPRVNTKKVNIDSTPYTLALQETFNRFSRSAVRKRNNREIWTFLTDPLDEAWLSWYTHELLMSEHVWLAIPSASAEVIWLPVTLTTEEEITILDKPNQNPYQLTFTATLDLNGTPLF